MNAYSQEIPCQFRILFVDDGSSDKTLPLLERLAQEYAEVEFLALARNFGHQHALKAGLDFSEGDCVISMDADLQHPPEMLPDLLNAWREGYDVVYTLRREDKSLSWFKRKSSNAFYALLNRLADIKLDAGAADFRLLDAKVMEFVRQNTEYHFFLRGYVSWLGFTQKRIPYTPAPRFAGKSKYTLKKMLRLAATGITSFSTKPLHFATLFGFFISGLAFLYAFYAIFMAIFAAQTVPGWASVLVSMLFLGGIQLIMLGIMGEYLGKLFMQAKNRPFYVLGKSSLPHPTKKEPHE
jgi:dolichol-phosphate mannosyltransferase